MPDDDPSNRVPQDHAAIARKAAADIQSSYLAHLIGGSVAAIPHVAEGAIGVIPATAIMRKVTGQK